jgi:hypothetical protein
VARELRSSVADPDSRALGANRVASTAVIVQRRESADASGAMLNGSESRGRSLRCADFMPRATIYHLGKDADRRAQPRIHA